MGTTKRKKRKPDLRKIRTTKTYTLPQIAIALDRHIGTVRSWVRKGLPTMDGNKPPIVHGSALKAWLKKKWAARKQKCKIDDLFCMKCKAPKQPNPDGISYEPHNEKTVRILANCSHCGTRMGKVASRVKLPEIRVAHSALQPHKRHLTGYSIANTKHTQNPTAITPPKKHQPMQQITLDFDALPMGSDKIKQAKENSNENAKTKP